jgi:hypothetical protein
MTALSIALLSLAGVLAVLTVPGWIALGAAKGPSGAGGAVGLLFLAFFRVMALLAGILSAAVAGRLMPIAPTIGGQLAACVFAVLVVEGAANWALWSTLDGLHGNSLQVVGVLLATVLPGSLVAAGLWAVLAGERQPWAGSLFWGSIVASVVCGALVGGITQTRRMEADEQFRQMRQQEEQQEARRAMEELQEKKNVIAQTAVADAEGLETLLAFTSSWERQDLSDLATARIRTADGYAERLAEIMNRGTHRVEALGVLAQDAQRLPEGVERQCWRAMESFAEQFLHDLDDEQTDPPLDALFRSALDLMNARADARKQHREELLAVQKVVRKAGEQHKIFSLEAMMRLRDIDHPQGDWAEAAQVGGL